MAKQRSEDFRDWDIDLENAYSGYDNNGFPFHIWRERADNRLTLSRPRYCCVTEENGKLYFTFFNPTLDIRSTGAQVVFGLVAALVVITVFVLGYLDYQNARGPYVSDNSAPPFVALIIAFFFSLVLGTTISVVWYVCVTVYRWINGRFHGDGRTFSIPLTSLVGFQVINADEAGAVVNGVPAKSGHGLAAVFEGGSQLILTKDPWTYRAIADHHRVMTNAFCTLRKDYVTKWEQLSQKESQSSPQLSTGNAQKQGGVPDRL